MRTRPKWTRASGQAPLEADVRREVLRLLEGSFCTVYDFSQGGRSRATGGTRLTAGTPDLFVFPPNGRRPFWVELKAPDLPGQLDWPEDQRARVYRAKQSPEQRQFDALCLRAQVGYVLGGRAEVYGWLKALGVLA